MSVKTSILDELYKIQLEVVCASVHDTCTHVGQQEDVTDDKMTLVQPKVTPIGSSSVTTPSMATKVSEQVDMSTSSSEGQEATSASSQAQVESTPSTVVTSCDILDPQVMTSDDVCSDVKKAQEKQAVVSVTLTAGTTTSTQQQQGRTLLS